MSTTLPGRRAKAASTAMTGVMVFAIVAALVIGIGPLLTGRQFMTVEGRSMEPTYHHGDLVLVDKTRTPELDDVVVYQLPGVGRVVHRVVGGDEHGYVLRGDNNPGDDLYRPDLDEVVGVVVVHVPHAGTIVRVTGVSLLAIGAAAVTTSLLAERKRRSTSAAA